VQLKKLLSFSTSFEVFETAAAVDSVTRRGRRQAGRPRCSVVDGLRDCRALLLLFGSVRELGDSGDDLAVGRSRSRLHDQSVLHGEILRHLRWRSGTGAARPDNCSRASGVHQYSQ